MKKFIYVLLVATFCSIAVTSCTEEEVQPVESGDTNGAGTNTGTKL